MVLKCIFFNSMWTWSSKRSNKCFKLSFFFFDLLFFSSLIFSFFLLFFPSLIHVPRKIITAHGLDWTEKTMIWYQKSFYKSRIFGRSNPNLLHGTFRTPFWFILEPPKGGSFNIMVPGPGYWLVWSGLWMGFFPGQSGTNQYYLRIHLGYLIIPWFYQLLLSWWRQWKDTETILTKFPLCYCSIPWFGNVKFHDPFSVMRYACMNVA